MYKLNFKYREDKTNILVIHIEDLKIGLQLQFKPTQIKASFKEHIEQCVISLKRNALKRGIVLEEQPLDDLIEYYSKGVDYVKNNPEPL